MDTTVNTKMPRYRTAEERRAAFRAARDREECRQSLLRRNGVEPTEAEIENDYQDFVAALENTKRLFDRWGIR